MVHSAAQHEQQANTDLGLPQRNEMRNVAEHLHTQTQISAYTGESKIVLVVLTECFLKHSA